MSTRKQRQNSKKKKKKQQRKKSASGDLPPQPKGDDMTAMKSMGYGAVGFVVIAVFFFLRLGGDTPFNHLVKLFSSDKPPVTAPKTDDGKSGKAPTRKALPTVAKNADRAPAQDRHTAKDQKSLDDLVESRTKKQ